MTSYVAPPKRWDHALSRPAPPNASSNASLIRSLETSGYPSSRARGSATVVLPAPGGPVTSTRISSIFNSLSGQDYVNVDSAGRRRQNDCAGDHAGVRKDDL